uniref:Exportin-T n=1 Tax=Syphacia muris TaxID=451379 RepID=A0A0N5ARU1_9BILA
MAVPLPLSAAADPNIHLKLYDYVENLKKDPNGWKLCIENIIKGNFASVEDHFLLLQVLESYVSKTYAVDDSGQEPVKLWMSTWISNLCAGETPPAFLANKVAQLFALIFAADFPLRWPNFIQEVFLQRLQYPVVVIFLLRTLIAIDSEVVDREIQRSKEIFDRNTQIKDAMRDLCMKDLAAVWTDILKKGGDTKAQELCLEVISCYVDWIDVELVVNDTMIPLIIDCLNRSETSDSAVRAICSIMEKGMDVDKKFSLVFALSTLLQSNNSLSVSQESDADDVIQNGSLINSIGLVYIDCYQKFEKNNDIGRAQECTRLMEGSVESALTCLSHEDIYASQTVVDFLRRYLIFLKGRDISDRHLCVLEQLVNIVVLRYKAPDEINLEVDGENEMEFLEYRKQLRGLLASVGNLKPEILISLIEPAVNTLCSGWEQSEIAPLEAVVSLIYYLPEILNTNFVMGKDETSLRAKGLVLQVITSNVSQRNALIVNRVFFEMACRYDKILATQPETLPAILEAFLDKRGLSNPSPSLRTRVVYLFTRFVKSHKIALSAYMSTVLRTLAPLLAISPLTGSIFSTDDQRFSLFQVFSDYSFTSSKGTFLRRIFFITCTSSNSRIFSKAVILEDPPNLENGINKVDDGCVSNQQMYLYEATSTLILYGSMDVTEKQVYMKELLGSLVNRFLSTHEQLASGTLTLEEKKILRDYLANIISYCSRITKPFMDTCTMRGCGMDGAFAELLNTFLEKACLDYPPVADALRQYLHRMVICLGDEFLLALPVIFGKFLNASSNLKALHGFLILLQQIIARFKEGLLTADVNLRLLFDVVWGVQAGKHDGTDEAVAENLRYLNRAYLQTMLALANNKLVPLVSNLGDSFMERFLASLLSFCICTDPVAQKVAINIICKINTSSPFTEQFWEKVVPLCKHHDTSDAQCMIVQHEATSCLLLLRQFSVDRFNRLLESILPVDIAEQFCQCLSLFLKGKELDKRVDEVYAALRQRTNSS